MGVDSGGASCCGCAWTSDSDRDGDGDDDGVVFLLCGRIAHPFGHRRGPIPFRWHQTCQSGTRRTERTNKPRTGVSSATLLRTSKCARFFHNKERERNINQKTELPIKREPKSPDVCACVFCICVSGTMRG